MLYMLSAQDHNSPAKQNAIHPVSCMNIHPLKWVNRNYVEDSMDVEKKKRGEMDHHQESLHNKVAILVLSQLQHTI